MARVQLDIFNDYIKKVNNGQKTDYKLINRLIKNNLFLTRNQFCYFFDYQTFSILHTSTGINSILGISPEEFTIEKYFEIIHPDDVLLVKKAAINALELNNDHRFEPFETILSIEYRIRHNDGHYLNVRRQSVILDVSESNNILSIVGIYTDITGLKRDNKVSYEFTGPGTEGFNVPEIDNGLGVQVTEREKQVLSLMAEGLNSKEIGDKLFISKSTVDDHRRKMLKKTGLKNSIELIVFGVRNGLV